MRALGLRWNIVLILVIVAILPLLFVGIGSGVVFSGLLESKAVQLQRSQVRSHAQAIDLYLAERLRALEVVARTHTREELTDPGKLREVFDELQATYGNAYVDLGVIDNDGQHVRYVGPYDLANRNYARARWFQDVMTEGSYVSDVFLGYRNVPHCVIAVKRTDGASPWILRATIDSTRFESLVGHREHDEEEEGRVFIVNRDGLYQTTPPAGSVLQPAIEPPTFHPGVRDQRVVVDGRPKVHVTSWLNDRRWMLVVQQDEAAIRAPVRRAMERGVIVTAFAVLLLVGTTILATRQLSNQIDRANAQRETLAKELLRSAKLASVGELATGLAHEINNPLAVISAERTNLSDELADAPLEPPVRKAVEESLERIKRQVQRCAGITSKMLRFGRSGDAKPRMIALGPPVAEIVRMLRKQAEVRNVELRVDMRDGLPQVLADSTELEQVLVNLINNSMHAMEEGGTIDIAAKVEGQEVLLSVSDTGKGIEPEHLERIFQPFFTTKPVGQGTGLGLSVCYGIVRGWGGSIEAKSRVGEGTTITIRLPLTGSSGDTSDPPARS